MLALFGIPVCLAQSLNGGRKCTSKTLAEPVPDEINLKKKKRSLTTSQNYLIEQVSLV